MERWPVRRRSLGRDQEEVEERWVVELEKCRKAKEGDPRKDWGLKNVISRLVRDDWREKAEEIRNRIIEDDFKSMKIENGVEPWNCLLYTSPSPRD